MKAKAIAAAASALSVLFVTAALGETQAPLPPLGAGFKSRYEIAARVRAAGFDPLAPPLREGTTYVLRATDYRGVLMRVVVDARSGAIRAVNRIVPGPASGQVGMIDSPYGPLPYPAYAARPSYGPYGPPPYRPPYGPPAYESPADGPAELDTPALAQWGERIVPPMPIPHAPRATAPATAASPPLPRPRPPALASQKPSDDTTSSVAVPSTTPTAPAAKPAEPPSSRATAPNAPPPPTTANKAAAPPLPPLPD